MLPLPLKLIAPLLAAMLAVPTAVLVAPAVLERDAADEGGDARDNLPPWYFPNGMGMFPNEGAVGHYACAAPARIGDVLAGLHEEGEEVCLEIALVTHNLTARRVTNSTTANFTMMAQSGHRIVAHISVNWWAHGTPEPGQVVTVEGRVVRANGTWEVNPVVRWVPLNHPGPEVEAWHVAAGHVAEGVHVWVDRTTVVAVWRNNDGEGGLGDNHIETGTACPTAKLTTETTPPYFGIIQAPPIGATVRMYGSVRWDDYHGHWEIHPIRAYEVLESDRALDGCPDRVGESGVPPPGISECVLSIVPVSPPLECPEPLRTSGAPVRSS